MQATIEQLCNLYNDMTWYNGKLAANIKCGSHNPWSLKFPLLTTYATPIDTAVYTPPDFNWEWIEEHTTPEEIDATFWEICESYTSEWVDGLEQEYTVNVHIDGRGGGWLVTDLTEESIMNLAGYEICGIQEELMRIENQVRTNNVWEDVALSFYYNLYAIPEGCGE